MKTINLIIERTRQEAERQCQARGIRRDRALALALAVEDLIHAVGPALGRLLEQHRIVGGKNFPERVCMLLATEFTALYWLDDVFVKGVQDAARFQAVCITLGVEDLLGLVQVLATHGGAFSRALKAWGKQ